MNVTREVILDLLPLYLSGEASAATRTLVEDFLEQDPDLAQRVRLAESIGNVPPSTLRPEAELRALQRTRRLIVWQKWLFGIGMSFTALSLSMQFTMIDGRLSDFHFLLQDYPVPFGGCLALGLICWVAYFSLRRRLRIAVF